MKTNYEKNKTYFDKIDFEKLPDSFVIKCNHGCKWHYIIDDKNRFLSNKRLFDMIKRNMTGWLEQEFWMWEGFEMQYAKSPRVKSPERKGFQDILKPKIFIEEYLKDKNVQTPRAIEIFCFNGEPKIYVDIQIDKTHRICVYNEDFSYSDLVLHPKGKELITQIPPDDLLKKSVELSKKLSKDFKFVRVDWMTYNNKLYFEELTFTPYSGFTSFNKKWNLKLGNWINL